MGKISMVYITASGRDEAVKIAEELLSLRLAACVNVFDGITSVYSWEGKVRRDEEAVLIAKTKEALLGELEKTVRKLHSYSCPCILAVPVVRASKDYAEWIARETR